jgi:hypothetical protein
MIESDEIKAEAPRTSSDKPCLALMGEFSAGKSTLSNLLIGAHSLPVQVTATQLPPVWIAKGDQPPYRVDLDGNVLPVDLNHLGDVEVEDTAYIRIFRDSDVLDMCDIIDMPGISDPSMAANVWQRVIHHATCVIWCTHATQAWRQSEAAVWDGLPPELHEKSLLLLTRMDKINSQSDRERLLRRVRRETEGLFRDVLPISLLQALEAGGDRDAWEASGAEVFTRKLVELLDDGGANERPWAAAGSAEAGEDPLRAGEDDDAASAPAGGVMPKRVMPRTGLRPSARRRDRPTPQAVHAR